MAIKVNKTINLQSFIGFLVIVVWQVYSADTPSRALVNILIAFGFVFLGIAKPGLGSFLRTLFEILNDQKKDVGEKIAAIRDAVQKLIGLWVDLSTIVPKLEEEKKEEVVDIPLKLE